MYLCVCVHTQVKSASEKGKGKWKGKWESPCLRFWLWLYLFHVSYSPCSLFHYYTNLNNFPRRQIHWKSIQISICSPLKTSFLHISTKLQIMYVDTWLYNIFGRQSVMKVWVFSIVFPSNFSIELIFLVFSVKMGNGCMKSFLVGFSF